MSIGATPTLCISLVAEALRAFRAAHPDIELRIVEGGSRLLGERLAAGRLDMALVTTSEGQPGGGGAIAHEPLLAEELVVVSSAAAEPISDSSVDIRRLARLPLISLAESYDLRAATDAAFAAAGLAPAPVIEGAEMDAVLRFVERGLGVAVVPATVPVDRPALRSVRLAAPRLERTIAIAHRGDMNPTGAAAKMRRTIVAAAGDLAVRAPDSVRLVARP